MTKPVHLLFALLVMLGAFLPSVDAAAPAQPLAYVVKVDGVITPATDELIGRHLSRAAKAKADVVVLEMHTPGGLYDSTQRIVQKILDSDVPVVTYVSPAGAHAASAGTYILYASHVAAMAPGTNIGAATPVKMNGSDSDEKSDPTMPHDKTPKKPMAQKMTNDAAAYIRSLAELRGRNTGWAEKAVRDADSLTAAEALSQKVVDVVSTDVPALLDKIHGRSVKMKDGQERKLNTKDARIDSHLPDWRTKILNVITHPNVAFILMTLGVYGLIYEFANPGVFLPGVAGAICLLLGLFALNVLPVSGAGVILLLGGLALMAAEALVPSFGALGIGGAIAFAAGAVMLIDSDVPGFGVDLWLIGAMTLSSLAILSVFLSMGIRAQRRRPVTGIEELVGAACHIVSWRQGRGEVRATGEIWQASADPIHIFNPGDAARVTAIDGLTLIITPDRKDT